MTKEVLKEKKAKKTYTPKKKPALTLSEFKAWLSGVEEMQSSNWTPDAGQWKTIRAKFEDIVEGTPANRVNNFNNENPYEREARQIRPGGPSGFSPQPTMAPMMQPMMQPMELPNPNRPIETPNTMPDLTSGEGVKKMVGRVKTPNIDTSRGNYTAAFE